MATTRLMLRERVRRILEGNPSTKSRIADLQIDYELGAYIAKALRIQVFEGFKDGQRTPDGAAIATYEGVPVVRRDNGRCVADLPAVPMLLPKGMGVFRVYPSGYPEMEYVPVMPGMLYALRGNKYFSCLGRRAYTYNNRSITLHSDAIAEGVTALDMELCVTDIAACGENDILPVPPDMEADAIIAVATLFGAMPATQPADNRQAAPSKADKQ